MLPDGSGDGTCCIFNVCAAQERERKERPIRQGLLRTSPPHDNNNSNGGRLQRNPLCRARDVVSDVLCGVFYRAVH